ncbi:hypothetical protein AVEN_247288-1 [Araneus ventricosus]|uniref:Uncharacterized protein n=1 Tax=Araneus ventricosus TaxID=182803 RepID=A0A4Y2NS30_ARAVE|nr:hypothetical protein AVEN_247288-1 [Araneus ventricosus]
MYLHLLASLVFQISLYRRRNLPLEFHDKFCHGVMEYLRSVRCVESTNYMTVGTTLNQQSDIPSLVASLFNQFTFLKPKNKLVTVFTICMETYDSPFTCDISEAKPLSFYRGSSFQ